MRQLQCNGHALARLIVGDMQSLTSHGCLFQKPQQFQGTNNEVAQFKRARRRRGRLAGAQKICKKRVKNAFLSEVCGSGYRAALRQVSSRGGPVSKGHSHAKSEPSSYVAHCVEVLRQSGARITRPRLAVLECLANARQSLGPKDLLASLQTGRKKPAIDLATIYRILEAFAELGLVHRVGPQGGYMACVHIDCAVDMHVVTHCLSCEQSQEVDLPADLQSAVSIYLKSATRFKPTDHFLQMNGLCGDCVLRDKVAAAKR